MAEKGWSLDEVQAMGAEGGSALESAQIIGAGAIKGLNESLNPLKVVAGLMRLSQGLMKTFPGMENIAAFTKVAEKEQDNIIAKLEKASEKTQGADIAINMPWISAVRSNLKELTGIDIADAPRSPQEAADRIGRAMTGTEKFLSTAAEITAGAIPVAGGLSNVAKFGGQMGYAAISGLGGALGEQIGGPTGKALGTLIGGVAAPLMVRGPTMARAVSDAEKAGRTPTLGQAMESKTLSAAENTLGRFGGVGVMARKAEADAAAVGKRVEETAARLSPSMEDARVGNLVTKGLADKESGFVGRFKERSSQLYDKVDRLVPPTTPVQLKNTTAVLDDALAAIPGAAATSRTFQSESLRRFYTSILEDVTTAAGAKLSPEQLTKLSTMRPSQLLGGVEMPYEAVKGLRSAIGRKIEDAGLIADFPKGELRRLYGAFSEDVKQSLSIGPMAAAQGDAPLKAWETANRFYKAGIQHIDNVIEPLVAKGIPERIMGSLEQNAKQGETTIKQVMSSLKPEERKVVSAWFVRQLGEATPGAQNATGTKFNIEKFATDWNKLTDGSKRVLFDTVGKKQYREDLDAIVRDAVRVKEGANVLRNPSGTSGATANIVTGAGLGGALLGGQYEVAAGIAGTYIAANLTARMLTSPTVVRTLARIGNTPKELAVQQLGQLVRNISDPDIAADVQALIDSMR